MKFAYVGNFDRLSVGEPEIARALESLGHLVIKVDTRNATIKQLQAAASQADVLLYAKFGVPIPQDEVAQFLTSLEIPKVCWVFDLFWGLPHREVMVRGIQYTGADLFLSTDGGNDDKFESIGIHNILLRQGIDETELGRVSTDKQNYPIAFIGSLNKSWPYRQKLLALLNKRYPRQFAHHGKDGSIRHRDLSEFVSSVEIVVGDSVRSPRYWSNRVYEIIGRGGFFIHQDVEGLSEEFKPYKHFVPYTHGNFASLYEIIDYYLGHNLDREKIALAGMEHCKKYTYTERVKQLLEIIKREL